MAAIQADTRKPERLIAIDWSGDKTTSGQKKKIWIADWNDGQVTLTSGRTREEAAEYLIAAASQTPRLVAGLDFAFSYPAWFLREENCRTAAQFWQLVANGKGEDWLRECSPPFWGRPGRRCPADHRPPASKGFRQTDRLLNEGRGTGGIQPKSPFQIGGAGAVGTGSLRGIPVLNKLRQAGFSIWPFTAPGFPAVLEIYPRLFTGPGNKSSRQFRAGHLARSKDAALPEAALTEATGSEDAFDALCSVIGMKDRPDEFMQLQQATDPIERLEGKIWSPRPKFTTESAERAANTKAL